MLPSGNMRVQPTARPPPRCRFKSFTAGKANGRNMTRQFPLAVAQFFIERTPPFRATGHSDTTAITPVLHVHRRLPHPREPTGCHPHSQTCTQTPFPRVRSPLDAQLLNPRAGGLRERYLVGRLLARTSLVWSPRNTRRVISGVDVVGGK